MHTVKLNILATLSASTLLHGHVTTQVENCFMTPSESLHSLDSKAPLHSFHQPLRAAALSVSVNLTTVIASERDLLHIASLTYCTYVTFLHHGAR